MANNNLTQSQSENQEIQLREIEGELLIEDVELGRRLGYANPTKIRELIKRHRENLNQISQLRTVGIRPEGGGRDVTAYYLNQKQSIFICMKSETDTAIDVQMEIVRVYDIYLQGKLTQPMHATVQPIDVKLKIGEAAVNWLRMSDTSKVRLLADISRSEGIDPGFLPRYVSEPQVKALTDLLKLHGVSLSARAVNPILIDIGILEEKERRSSNSTTKTFKSLTKKGLDFGKNEVSPNSPRETHPLYFEEKFPELLRMIQARMKPEITVEDLV